MSLSLLIVVRVAVGAQARKGARIRKGGPGEELALAEHLASLAPTPQRLAEAGALAEALVRGDIPGCSRKCAAVHCRHR